MEFGSELWGFKERSRREGLALHRMVYRFGTWRSSPGEQCYSKRIDRIVQLYCIASKGRNVGRSLIAGLCCGKPSLYSCLCFTNCEGDRPIDRYQPQESESCEDLVLWKVGNNQDFWQKLFCHCITAWMVHVGIWAVTSEAWIWWSRC